MVPKYFLKLLIMSQSYNSRILLNQILKFALDDDTSMECLLKMIIN